MTNLVPPGTFGVRRLLLSVCLLSITLGCARAIWVLGDDYVWLPLQLMLFVVAVAVLFAAIGTLFRCGVAAFLLGLTLAMAAVVWLVVTVARGLNGG